MAKSKNITAEEHEQVHALGYIIREHWISPGEGWEFMPTHLGGRALASRKSQRAAYNFIMRREIAKGVSNVSEM